MNVMPLNMLNESLSPALPASPVPAALLGGGVAGGRFADMLDDARREKQQPDQVREAARELVSIAFLTPLLKQARQDPFRSDLFHGGQGEEVFGAQLDEQMADRMSQSMKLPLADAVYRQFAGNGKGASNG